MIKLAEPKAKIVKIALNKDFTFPLEKLEEKITKNKIINS